jgi:RNA polymerase sigma factor (sigma-70 family)
MTPERAAPAADQHLLQRFAAQRDEEAFAELVRRHGPLVFGVCQRVLHNPHDAEDAFQATFLVLVRKAWAIRKQQSLASWLYGVAYRVARKAQARAASRGAHEPRTAAMNQFDPSAEATWKEIRHLLDEEVQRLPEKYRAPLLLCYFEGKTQDEAAGQLGWAPGIFRGRLDRGRECLRQRLIRRGVTVAGGLFVAALSEGAASAVPPALMTSTVEAASAFAAGQAIGPAAALTEGVLKTMFVSKLIVVAVTGSVLALVLAGVGAAVMLATGGPWFAVSEHASSDVPRLEIDPALRKDGILCQDVGRSASVDSSPFRRVEEYSIEVHVTAGMNALGKDDLFYTLYDAAGKKLSGGKVPLASGLAAGKKGTAHISDVAIGKAQRLVIHK